MINQLLLNALDGLKGLNIILCLKFSPSMEVLRVMFSESEVLK